MDPIEAEFANGTTFRMSQAARLHLYMGDYSADLEFLVCPVGQQLILGTPWYEDVLATIDLGSKKISFKERAWPGAPYFAPKVYRVPLMTKTDLIKFRIKWGKKHHGQKTKHKQIIKNHRKNIRFVATITSKELERIAKSCQIFNVLYHQIEDSQSKEVLRGEESNSGFVKEVTVLDENGIIEVTPPAIHPEATARSEDALASLSPDAVEVVTKYATVFDPPTMLPPNRPEDIKINLKEGAHPPKIKGMARLNEKEILLLKETLTRLLERQQIQPSTSEYGARVLFVKKQDGTMRMCIDYRDLNEITVKNRCPIPNMAEMRDRVRGAKVFRKPILGMVITIFVYMKILYRRQLFELALDCLNFEFYLLA